jgi:hypothetical protein
MHLPLAPVFPLAAGGGVMCVLAFLASRVEQIVDAAWFGLEDQVFLGRLASLWVALFLVSALLYGLARATRSLSKIARKQPVVVWASTFLAFLTVLYCIVGVHYVILVETAGDAPRGVLAFHDLFEILMTSSVVALAWPHAFGFRPSSRRTPAIFCLSLVGMGLAFVLLEPDSARFVLIALGVLGPPPDFVGGGDFLSALPYLAPIPPLVWSLFEGWPARKAGSSPPTVSTSPTARRA